MSGKSTLFGHFFVKYFQITCLHICISLNKNDNILILHTCLTSSSSCLCSTADYLMILLWFWVLQVKKTKTIVSSWFHWKLNFSENLIFNHFYNSYWYIKNGILHMNLFKLKIWNIKNKLKSFWESAEKMAVMLEFVK